MIFSGQGGALFSTYRRYRYPLWRIWEDTKPTVLFVGLNPSTANEQLDDPTLIRCINYAKAWGYGGVMMGNLFAYRVTDPKELFQVTEPIGVENNMWLKNLASEADLVVAAWGNMGTHLGRSQEVISFLPNLHCLKRNKSGEPAHPLYLKADLRPFPLELPLIKFGSQIGR